MIKSLDALGTRLGTDKGSVGQGYLAHYERNLAPLKDTAFTLLEIGVAQGASLQMWREYFPKANIVGVDIDETCKRFARDNIHVEIGSQSDVEFLTRIGLEYKPLVIIDDGSHFAVHNMVSFSALFPVLAPGGIYIIEDLYLHYTNPSVYRVGETILPSDYFASLAINLAAENAGVEPIRDGGNDILRQIDRIEFFRRGILIQKTAVFDAAATLAAAWPLVESANNAHLWHTVSAFILRNGLDLEKAAAAARGAIAVAPKAATHFIRLADILERQGDVPKALDAARTARQLDPADEGIGRWVERLEKLAPR